MYHTSLDREPPPDLEETDNKNSYEDEEGPQTRLGWQYDPWHHKYKYEEVLGYWTATIQVQKQPPQENNNIRKFCNKGYNKLERIRKE